MLEEMVSHLAVNVRIPVVLDRGYTTWADVERLYSQRVSGGSVCVNE